MSFLCLVSVFKNESHILEEWMQHYIKQGVDHFFLTDNGSTDNYRPILDKYISRGIVSLNVSPTKHQQEKNINFFLEENKKYKWTMQCDLDEFIYARNGFKNVKSYLETLHNRVNVIYLCWKMFGSSGLIKQPDSVVSNFLMRGNGDRGHIGTKTLGKYIVRSSLIQYLGVHSCILTDDSGIRMTSDGSTELHDDLQFVSSNEEKLSKYCLHCNHYAIQSREWFESVKMTRGDVNRSANENVRNDWYFKAYDLNDLLDDELKNINSM